MLPEIALRVSAACLALFALFGFNPQALAATETWTGTGNSAAWNTATDWSNSTAPGATAGTTNGDTAIFNTAVATGTYGGASGNPINTPSGENIENISFTTAAGSFFIGSTGSSALLLTSGGEIQILNGITSTNSTETINAPLVIEGAAGTYTFANGAANGTGAGAATLDFGGAISGGAAGATVLTLAGANTNANTISGAISNGSATTMAVTKSGAGTWVLSGVNTYTGNTTISSGTLSLAGTLGSAGGTGISNSGTFSETAAGVITGTSTLTNAAGATTLSGANTFTGATTVSGGTLTLSNASALQDSVLIGNGGTIVFGASDTLGGLSGSQNLPSSGSLTALTLNLQSGASNTFSGAIQNETGTVALTVSGASSGVQTLSGVNTYTGSTTISAGTLTIGGAGELNSGSYAGNISNAGTFTYNSSATQTLSGAISGAGALNVSAGALTISGSNTFTGITTVGGGTLTLGNANALQDSVLNGNGGTIVFGASDTLGGLTGSQNLPSSGSLTTLTLNLQSGPGSTYSGAIQNETGPVALTSTGAATSIQYLSGANTYSGATTLNGGILDFASPTALYDGTTSDWTASNIIVKSGATLAVQVGSSNFTSGNLGTLLGMSSSASGGFETGSILGLDTTPGNFTYSSAIANGYGGSTLGLTKLGPNTLTLSGVNTYTGNTTISVGTLTIGGAGELNSGSYAGNISNAGTFIYNSSATQTLSGAISGAGALNVSAGALTISGSDTYTGFTTVSGGTLTLGNAYALQDSVLNGNGGTIVFGASDTLGGLTGSQSLPSTGSLTTLTLNLQSGATNTYSGVIQNETGTVALTSTGASSGVQILTGANTYTGATTAGGGTLQIGNGTSGSISNSSASTVIAGAKLAFDMPTSTGTYTGTIADAGTVLGSVGIGGTNTLTGVISGGGGLTENGAGTLILKDSAVNTYTGSTTVNAGTLDLNYTSLASGNLINSSSALVLGGGTLQIVGNGSAVSTGTFNGTTINAGESVITVAPASGANNPNLALGAITANAGGSVEFIGPATINGSGNVAATGTILTTSSGSGIAPGSPAYGLLASGGNNNDYATVGLYDWASTDLANDTAATPYTIIGGSQVTNFYTASVNNGTLTGNSNIDMTTQQTPSLGSTSNVRISGNTTVDSIRFNSGHAPYITIKSGDILADGGVLVTPNMGTINAGIDAIRLSSAVGLQIVQNDTSDVFCLGLNGNQVINTGNAGDYVVFSGAGTTFLNPITGTQIAFNYLNASNAVTQSTSTYYDSTQVGSAALGTQYLNGGTVAINSGAAFSNPATMATTAGGVGTLNMNGGTIMGVVNSVTLTDAAGAARNIFLGINGGGLATEGGGSISTVGQVPTTLTVGGVITGAAGTGPLIIGIPAEAANGNVLGLVPGTGPNTANPAYYALGTVVLNNTSNVYTGGTVLDSGTLQLTTSNLNVLGTGGVTLNGGSFQWASSNTTDLSARTITLASGGYFDTNGNNVTFANSIGNSGTGGFTKIGAGTLTMNGANTYTGPVTVANGNLTFGGANVYTGATTISSGTLTLASGGSLGATAVSVANGATLQASQSNSGMGAGAGLTLNNGSTLSLVDNAIGSFTTAGTFTLSGTSSLDFDMNQTTADSITVTGGGVLGTGVGTIYLNTITGTTAPSSPTTYTLFTDSAGFGSATFALGNASTIIGGTSYVFTLSNTGTAEKITLTAGSLNYYWTGGTNSSWNTLANFAQDHTGAQQQTVALNGVDNVFLTADSATNFSQTLDGNYTINSVNFTGTNAGTVTAAATNPVTLASGTGTVLTLGGNNTYLDTAGNIYTGKGLVVQAGAAADTITANINLGHSQTWEIDNSSTNALLVSGTIADGSTLDSLTKIGVGELILSATNLYDGGTIVSGGALMLGATNALLTTAPLTVQGTGTFDLAGNNQTVSSLSDGGVSTGVITSSTGSSTFTINNITANTFSGTVSGSTSIVMTGTSSLTLSGSNSYAGTTTVSAGTVNATNSYSLSSGTLNALTLNPASGTATVNLSGPAPSVASLTSSGAGISSIVLGNITGSGTATTLTVGSGGATTIFGGNISDGTTGVGAKATAIGSLVLSGGQLTLNGTGTYTGTTTLTGGTLIIGNFLAIEDSTLNYNNQGGALSFGSATAATFGGLSGAQNLALTNTNATPGAVALTIGNNNESSTTTGNLGGLGSLFKVGSGTFQAGSGTSGGATYAGTTLVNQGTLILGGTTTLTSNIDVGAVGGTSALTIQDNASVNSPGVLEIASDDSTANGSEQNGNPGVSTLLITGTAQVTATGLSIGNVTGGGPSRVPTGDSITISGLANVTINGIDTLDNTEGSTASAVTENLNGGTLAVNSIALGFANGTTQTATLHLNGGTLEALANDPSGTVFFLPATTGITVDVDSGGAFINTNGYNISIAAALVPGTAGGGLTVSGGGSLALLGSDTYTGATTINAGATLQFGNGVTGDDGTLTASSGIADAGALIFDRFGSVTSGIAISGTGTVTVTGTGGTEILTAVNGYSGPTTINSGATLQLGNGTSSHDGTIESTSSLTDNGTLAFDRSGSLSSAVAITGTGNVTVSGTGSQTLIAVSNYSGATTINTGATLQLGDGTTGHDGNITASSGIADAGALIFDRFGSVSSGVAISGTGKVTVSGTGGTEVLTAVNGYTGPTTINSGATLQLGDGTSGDDGAIESTSSLTDNGTLAFNRFGSLSSAVVIGGTGSVTISGPGSQTLIATNTYNGPTTINTGATLQLGDGTTGHDGTIASTTGILDNGLLIYDRSGNLSSGIVISGTGNVTISGAGSQTLTASNGYSGGTTINSGATLQLGNGTSGNDGTILNSSGILDNGTLIYNRSGSLSSGVAISGGGNVIVSGTGSQTLTGVNTYNGTTTVDASSKLALGSGGSLGNTAVTVNGTLLANQGNGGIGGSVTLNNGSTLSQEDGAIGSLTLGGLSISPSANANINYDLFGSTADTINVTGGALGGTGNGVINFDYLGGGTPADAQQYTLLSDTSGLGSDTFSLGVNIVTIGGQGFTLSLANSTSTAEILTFNDITNNYYWTGGTSASWSALPNFATNHLGTVQQSFNLSNTSNVFLTADSASHYSQTLDGSYSINSLSLTGTSAVAPGNTTGAASNPVTLAAGTGGTLTINASTAFTDADGVSYSVGLEVQPGSAGGTISANIDLGNTQTWEIDGNALLVSGTIANGGGSDGLIKSGTGTLILSAANTYGGGTTVSAGTLALQSGGSIGSAGTLNITGGTFDLAGNPQTLGGLTGSSPGVVTSSAGAATLTVNDNSPAIFAGTITDNNGVNSSSLSLVFQGSSSETLSGSNSYSGGTTLSSGVLVASNNYSLGNSTSATGGLTLNPSATAQAEFTSATPQIASLASSGAGTSMVVLGNAGGGGSATTLTVGGGGQTTVFGGVISDLSGSAPAAIGSLTIAGGSLTLTNANTYTGATTINSGATLQLGNGASGNDGTILDSTGILDNGLLIYNRFGSLTSGVAISGTGNVTISGPGSQTLTAVNTYSGATTISSGATLQLGNGSIDGTINNSSGVLDNGLLIFDPASSLSFGLAISGTGNVTITDPGSETLTTASTYSGATTINSGAVLQLGDGTSGHDGTIEDSSGVLDNGLLIFNRFGNLSTAVVISGTGSVTISGPGSQTLTASNTYSGATTISPGATLQLGDGTSGHDGTIENSGGVTDNGTLVFYRSGNLSSAVAISGTGNVTVSGTGSQTLIATNTYSGATTVNTGATLQLGDGTSGHDGTVENTTGIANGGTLVFNRSGNSTSAVVISGAGNVTISGTGSQTLTAHSTYTGWTSINIAATLKLGNGSGGGDGTIDDSSGVSDGGSLVFDRAGSLSTGLVISGAGSVTVEGSGSQTLTGHSTFQGATTVDPGATLQLGDGTSGNDGTIADTSVVNDNGTLIFNRFANDTFGVSIDGSGAVTVAGGTEALTAGSLYNGATTVDPGATLQLGDGTPGNDGTIENSSGVTDNGTLAFNRSGSVSSAVPISGLGAVTVSGGGSQTLLATNTYQGATTINSGATLQLGNGASGNDGTIENTSSITNNGTLAFDRSGNVSSAVAISGTGNVTVSGAGSQTLSANSTYTGATTVNAGGTLIVSGSLSGATAVTASGKLEVDGLVNNGATVNVTAGGKLSGDGSVGAVDDSGGRIDPGFSTDSTTVGVLAANGNVTLGSGSLFSIRIGLTDGSDSDTDQLSVGGGGTFSLSDGTTILRIIEGGPENNISLLDNVYVIVNGGADESTGIGTGTDVFENAPASGDTFTNAHGYEYAVLYATDAAGDGYGTGNDVAVELLSIPEPGTWASLICGIGMLLVWRRSRRRNA